MFAFVLACVSSESNLEKLLANLLNTNEIERTSLLNEIANLYLEQSPDLALSYAQRALELAKKHQLKFEMTQAYRNLGVANEHLNQYHEALQFLQNGFTLAEKITLAL